MKISLKNTTNYFIFFLVLSSIFFTRAFGFYRLPLVTICFILALVNILRDARYKIDLCDIVLIIIVPIGAVLWSILGLVHGNNEQAIYDTLRLFVVFYIIYIVLTLYASKYITYRDVEFVFCIGSIFIFFFSIILFFDASIIPSIVIDAMDARIGIHDGYIQITTHHIGMLALTVPYLICISIYNVSHNVILVRFSVILGVIAIALSSRRAIYLVLLLLPALLLFVHTFSMVNIKHGITKIYRFTIVSTLFSISVLYICYEVFPLQFSSFSERIIEAVSQLDKSENNLSERAVQAKALLSGVANNPLFGCGFGSTTAVVRNEKAWVFELSYHALLLNVGVFGFTIFIISTLMLFARAMHYIKKIDIDDLSRFHGISLITSFISMYIISYSNPYISSSYDFLIANFILPFIIFKEFHKRYEN